MTGGPHHGEAGRRPVGPGRISLFACPQCGRTIEFWPHELARLCPDCGCRVVNAEATHNCMDSCPYASECMEALRAGTKRPAPAATELRKDPRART